jgi:pimeloyl-ACP methyl ester carboxylesterase
VYAVDLQAGLVVERAAMSNYAAVVACTANLCPAPRALLGWSLGGLAAMMAAERAEAERLVLLEPSPPAEVQGTSDVAPVEGTFDPEEEYGPFPGGIRARPESLLARTERKRGISIPALPCSALVAYGEQYAEERGRAVAQQYGAEELQAPVATHWDLVLDAEVRQSIADWLQADSASRASPSCT